MIAIDAEGSGTVAIGVNVRGNRVGEAVALGIACREVANDSVSGTVFGEAESLVVEDGYFFGVLNFGFF